MSVIVRALPLRQPTNVKPALTVLIYCAIAAVLGMTNAACKAQRIYTGHDGIARLRGIEVHSGTLSSADMSELRTWGNNEVRYQLIYTGPAYRYSDGSGVNKDQDVSSQDLANYQAWLRDEVQDPQSDLNRTITFCAHHAMKIVIDLQSPPGNDTSDGPFRIFLYQDDLSAFYADWALFASSYSLNSNSSAISVAARTAIWGYDLCNEPDDNPHGNATSLIADWNEVDVAAARIVRQYDNSQGSVDPVHAIIVECSQGYPPYFPRLKPLPLAICGVVYSVHMYEWYQYTFQGLPSYPPVGTYTWPTKVGETTYDSAWLTKFLQPVRDFQLANNVQIYDGEFSAGRYASASNEYLNELIDIFERYGWDWNYHCFREADIWDAEMGPDPTNLTRFETTDRKTILMKWFENNHSPVADFDFASPSLGKGARGYIYDLIDTAWKFNKESGLAGNGSGLSNPPSETGATVAFVEHSGVISQLIDWKPNTTYAVSFTAVQAANNSANQPIAVYVGGSVAHGALVGAKLVGAITPSNSSWATYASDPFTVGSGPARLTFVGAPSSDLHAVAFIGDVFVTGMPVELRNPSFEFSAPSIDSNSEIVDPIGCEWVFSGNSGIASNGSSLHNPDAVDGTHVAFLGQSGIITSAASIGTWDPDATYKLGVSIVQATLASPQTVAVFIDNAQIGTITASSTSFSTTWLGPFRAGPLPAGGTGHTISFRGIGGCSTSMVFLDNIRLAVSSPSASH